MGSAEVHFIGHELGRMRVPVFAARCISKGRKPRPNLVIVRQRPRHAAATAGLRGFFQKARYFYSGDSGETPSPTAAAASDLFIEAAAAPRAEPRSAVLVPCPATTIAGSVAASDGLVAAEDE